MSEGIIQRSESFVQELLGRELQAAHHFHNWIHTNEVRQQALTIGRRVGLSAADLEVLELAALFHDVGYIEAYDGHEAVSQGIAERFLIAQGYPAARCQRITAAIAATRYDCEPRNPLEAILRAHHAESAGAILDALHADVRTYTDDAPLSDDLTALVLKRG